MLIVFILSNTFSLQFSALKNPSMYPVRVVGEETLHRNGTSYIERLVGRSRQGPCVGFLPGGCR